MPADVIASSDYLTPVLEAMKREELVALLKGPLNNASFEEKMASRDLPGLIAEELSRAAAYSFPWSKHPSYPDIVRMVAKQLKLPAREHLTVSEMEGAILFKIMEKSLEKMSDEQKKRLVLEVRKELKQKGITKRVTFSEVAHFVKFAGVDAGSMLGGLALAAPGVAGVVGLNFLQFAVLKGIILTSGYVAGGTALLGIGFGGALMTTAGVAGPIGAGLALIYAGYAISGPAFRKLIPAVCVIAAKRIELEGGAEV